MKESLGSRGTLSPDTLRVRGWTVPGMIYRRGRKFVLKLYSHRAQGSPRYKRLTFTTYAEAVAAQRELASHTLAHAAGVGLYGSPRERLGRYLADWLGRQRPRLAAKTFQWYEIVVGQIQQDQVGTIPLGRLAPRALEAYYERKRASGISPTTVLHHHRLLHTALKDAERQDLILKNPAATAKAPRRARVKLDVWDEPQTLLFLSESKAISRQYPLYLFLVASGTRIGEALGLTWRGVGFRDGVVYIDQALQRPRGGGFTLTGPKTIHSRRPLSLAPEAMEELRRQKARHAATRAQEGVCEEGAGCRRYRCPRWHDLDLVFCQANGKPLFDNNIRLRDLYPLCKRIGLPYRRALHNLRHAHGTLLLEHGVHIKTVQARLGHATAAFTLSTYAHVLAGAERQGASAISEMLRGMVT